MLYLRKTRETHLIHKVAFAGLSYIHEREYSRVFLTMTNATSNHLTALLFLQCFVDIFQASCSSLATPSRSYTQALTRLLFQFSRKLSPTAEMRLIEQGAVFALSPEWSLRAFAETDPRNDGCEEYFYGFASAAAAAQKASPEKAPTRVISVCVTCYNEESDDLVRTLTSLKSLRIPPRSVLETLIVIDGVLMMSASMKEYIDSMFGTNIARNGTTPGEDIFDTCTFAETITVEPSDRTSSQENQGVFGLSMAIKKNNQGKVNSHKWWLGKAYATNEYCYE
jgi:hypothetical protein